jgi:pSer/pThr/pTyr-binding forkhead associated (FHA) protein
LLLIGDAFLATGSEPMRCVLTVQSGPAVGASYCLRGVDIVQFGRTDWADYAIPDDDELDRVHFCIESERSGVSVRDLGSNRGTWLNGSRIECAELRHGDLIAAGKTSLRVDFDRLDPRRSASVARSIVASTEVFPYDRAIVRSGIACYMGRGDRASRDALVTMLRKRFALHLLINFKRALLDVPHRLRTSLDLLDGMAAALRQDNSLHYVGPEVDCVELLQRAWDRDAATALFAPQEYGDIISPLRGSYAPFLRPSTLRVQFEMAPLALAGRLFGSAAAILVEGTTPGTWKLFANPQIAPDWQDVGLPVGPAN